MLLSLLYSRPRSSGHDNPDNNRKFEFLSIESWLKAVRDPLNLQQLAENLELSKEQTYEAAFRADVVQRNDCPCILLMGFGFVFCLNKGVAFALY